MGIFYQPPQVPTSARTIVPELYPVVVSYPPFGQKRSSQDLAANIDWLPPDPVPTQSLRLAALPGWSVDNPPLGNLGRVNLARVISDSWIPGPPAPQRFNPSILPANYPVIVFNPPWDYPGNAKQVSFRQILSSWMSPSLPDPQPQRMPPEAALPGWSVDRPTGWRPFQWQTNPFWQVQDSGPQQLRILNPGAYVIIVPSFVSIGSIGASLYTILSSWNPDPNLPNQRIRTAIPQLYPFAVSNPPFSGRARALPLSSLMQDIDFSPYIKRAIFPQGWIPSAFVPFSRFNRPEIWSIIRAWETTPGQAGKIILPGISVPGYSKIFVVDAKGMIYSVEPDILVVKSEADASSFIAEAKDLLARAGFKILSFMAKKEESDG